MQLPEQYDHKYENTDDSKTYVGYNQAPKRSIPVGDIEVEVNPEGSQGAVNVDFDVNDRLKINSTQDGKVDIVFLADDGSTLVVNTTYEGKMNLQLNSYEGDSFEFESDGDSFIIPGLEVETSTGKLKFMPYDRGLVIDPSDNFATFIK